MNKKKNIKPLISVIIPVYNEEKYIKKCITSVRNQTLNNFEIITVDDGSTDLTHKIISRLGIKLLKINHRGPGRAKNIGAEVAKGQILVFIDADMIIDKNYLKNIIRPILKGKCFATYSTAEYIANNKNIWSRCWNINNGLSLNRRLAENDRTSGLVVRAILKDKFIISGGFDSKLGYFDDRSLSKKGIYATPVSDAKCYHYNPESLKDVYFSARWIGRSLEFNTPLINLFKYSIVNSLKISFQKILNGAPLLFLIFKIIFDFGIFSGILCKYLNHNYAK